jgi:hypothetical protein
VKKSSIGTLDLITRLESGKACMSVLFEREIRSHVAHVDRGKPTSFLYDELLIRSACDSNDPESEDGNCRSCVA